MRCGHWFRKACKRIRGKSSLVCRDLAWELAEGGVVAGMLPVHLLGTAGVHLSKVPNLGVPLFYSKIKGLANR